MSAAVSLADRCLDPPENTSRVVGETAGCQGRVSACQWCVPFHGVDGVHTQRLSRPRKGVLRRERPFFCRGGSGHDSSRDDQRDTRGRAIASPGRGAVRS